MRIQGPNVTESYIVKQCPEFIRDAWEGGHKRLEEGSRWENLYIGSVVG